jgi:cytochrome c heme-lyase
MASVDSGGSTDTTGALPSPLRPTAAPAAGGSGAAVAPSRCPVDHGSGGSDGESAALQPHAMRPPSVDAAAAAASPLARTQQPLGENRVHSTISKTGSESTWVYPSDRMFYEALRRKGYAPRAQDMRATVAIHNTVNEQAWREVMKWESLHACEECSLLTFKGRPKDLSVKAKMWNFLGYTLPFDRHDWTVDRCGTPVRYIIDFYTGTWRARRARRSATPPPLPPPSRARACALPERCSHAPASSSRPPPSSVRAQGRRTLASRYRSSSTRAQRSIAPGRSSTACACRSHVCGAARSSAACGRGH